MPDGVTCTRPDNDNLLLRLLSRDVKARPSILVSGIFGDATSEYEVSDEVEDSDDG